MANVIMKRPLYLLALIPIGLWAAFALPDLLAADKSGPWFWRRNLILLSGIVALWWMSAGMLLATRAPWLENRFGGLDRLYRLHKNIGIGAGLLVLLHWQLEWLPKTLAKAGLITGPNRPGVPSQPDFWVDLAKDVGEWSGYILMALVVIALIRRLPYHWFRVVHKLFGVIFLGGVFHGLLLIPKDFWQTPLAWATLAVAALGVVPALLSLSGRIGRKRQYAARVESVRQAEEQVLEIVCRTDHNTWPGHRAGQFLFVDFGERGEGAHPFTIASAWNPDDGSLTLAIKALGDYTAKLPDRVAAGQAVRLEGPYGHFDFAAHTPHENTPQIWIAGGIGITPFLARLQELAERGARANVDLYYSSTGSAVFPEQLDSLCARTGVRLHRRLSDRDGPFTADEITRNGVADGSVWFCGPQAWGEALARLFKKRGLSAQNFHQEAFEFR